jgi:hypothetical protein
MTKYFLCLFALAFLLSGCAAEKRLHLPELANVSGVQGVPGANVAGANAALHEHGAQACANVFPQGNWQFVHSIDFSMRDGSGTTVAGITTLNGKDMSCALVTVEGLTLFAADFHQDNSFEVRRAVPPFDSNDFAKGMMADIRAIFHPPAGSKVQQGQLAGATPVCRYADAEGGVVDVLPNVGDCWQIKSYTPSLIMNRSIVGQSCRKNDSITIPDYLELKTYGHAGYTLKMKLISADKIK